MSKIIFIYISNADRSPCLENHFRDKFPQHEYRSAGINKFYTSTKGTHYLTQEDIEWVYAERCPPQGCGQEL